ncbi:RHS repeat-associated core domain-containing protein [Flavobacterium branchiarum]|uniref:RHS repeat-associated core domain-containing protein n=1 Tax=Flavobacterium branchiarum TaxID=1114870 RepID=A0ABV5FK87_9FLAO|nr:RHS repeat-associated core domain-containing protein [Flavobacterium branchiarum]MDN3672410.1 RHS repeat-associated core domain-containing protein [Flavobacterium branchiarum]
MPFGEVLFEEHSSSFSSPNLFNGKELDRETNMTYYSARYLDMKTSLWLNVDPLAEKMPNYGAYAFCFNNPIRFVDPDGREGDDWVARADNSVYWDDNATSQRTTKDGETYLGKEVSYTSERGTTVNLHSNKTWSEQLVFANINTDNNINSDNNAVQNETTSSSAIDLGGVANAVLVTNIYTEALASLSNSNAKLVMKYGSGEFSAAQLTIQNSTRMTKIAGAAGLSGKVLGGLSLGITAYQYGSGQISGREASIDGVMGVVGFLGPIGAATSLTYFTGKAIYEYSSGETVFEKPKN